MFRRNIDFLAVFVIAVAMLGFSKAASLKLPDAMDAFQMQNAVNVDHCADARRSAIAHRLYPESVSCATLPYDRGSERELQQPRP